MKHAQLWAQARVEELLRSALQSYARLRWSFSSTSNLEDSADDPAFKKELQAVKKTLQSLKANVQAYGQKTGLSRMR